MFHILFHEFGCLMNTHLGLLYHTGGFVSLSLSNIFLCLIILSALMSTLSDTYIASTLH